MKKLELTRTGKALGSSFLLTLTGLGSAALVACTPSLYIKGDTQIAAAAPDVPPAAPCPTVPVPAPTKRVEVKDKSIAIAEKIQFEQGKAVIKSASNALLDEIVSVLKDNPRIKKVAVEGHASADGDAKDNKKLSDDRAKAVVAYIVGKGVDATRLEAKGWGEEKPIADNKTEEGREKNRRVEFNIVAQDPAAATKTPPIVPPAKGPGGEPPKPPKPSILPRKAGKQ